MQAIGSSTIGEAKTAATDYQSAAANPEFHGKGITDAINQRVTLVFRWDRVDEQGQEWQQMSVNVTKNSSQQESENSYSDGRFRERLAFHRRIDSMVIVPRRAPRCNFPSATHR